jgi:hypothetical protein
LLEHAASIGERWGEREIPSPQELFRGGPGSVYSFLSVLTVSHLKHLDGPTFLRTVLGLAELAFFGAFLPSQHRFRQEAVSVCDVHPLARFQLAVEVAGHAAPPVEDSEVAAFQETICERLGWTPPSRMSIPESSAEAPANIYLRLYWEAQRLRASRPFCFIDLGVWQAPVAPAVQRFRALFSHPIMEFKDSTLVAKDRELVKELFYSYIVQSSMERLMTSPELTITVPVRAAEPLFVAADEMLSHLVGGMKLPSVRLRFA